MTVVSISRAEKYVAELTGREFGRLTIKAFAGRRFGNTLVECECRCGQVVVRQLSHVAGGTTESCGCLWREVRATQGGIAATLEAGIWRSMIARCHNPKSKAFPLYGGRGISVCERWRQSLADFLEDMGPRPSRKHSVDRRDNDGNYEPDNCRWATRTEQQQNRNNNLVLELNGERHCLVEWARRLGISYRTIAKRIEMGWTAEKAMTTPVDKRFSTSVAGGGRKYATAI